MLHHIATAVYKRAAEGSGPQYELPSWSWAVILADLIVFLPVILVLTYTLQKVYPIFAIVEDENPPAYDPVNLNDDDAASESAVPGVGPIPPKVTGGRPTTVTSSLRSINRLLMANGGWRANFRGFFCMLAQAAATGFLFSIFSAFLPGVLATVGTLLAALALVQLSTAWVHIVITPRSPLHFWSRLPPFKRTFDATARPVVAYWLATNLATWVPIAVGWAIGLDLAKFRYNHASGTEPAGPGAGDAWKSIVITLLSLAMHVLIVIPAHVVLVRVQASLLPEEADTIIPFDRSFEGKVEPRVVGGKGYATMSDAWATFSRDAWRRLVILYVKVFAVCTAAFFVMAAIVIPEVLLMASKSTKN